MASNSEFLRLVKQELIEEGVPRQLFDYLDDRIKELLADAVSQAMGDLEESLAEKFIKRGDRLG